MQAVGWHQQLWTDLQGGKALYIVLPTEWLVALIIAVNCRYCSNALQGTYALVWLSQVKQLAAFRQRRSVCYGVQPNEQLLVSKEGNRCYSQCFWILCMTLQGVEVA